MTPASTYDFRMLLEKLTAVQALAPEEKWLLIDELWHELARQIDKTPADSQTLALLEAQFAQYVADPESAGSPAEEVLARLAERKRQWK
jgi:putative addiction module component (TIGR02574 family)